MSDFTKYFDWLMGGLGMSSGALVAGCDECDGPEAWPESRAVVYAYLVIAIYALAREVGVVPVITSGYRCAPCNERRDGATRSRHLAETGGGKPYGAVDIQWEAGKIDVLIENIDQIPDLIRQATGLTVGVGVIAYPGRRRLHLDLRENDYVNDKT